MSKDDLFFYWHFFFSPIKNKYKYIPHKKENQKLYTFPLLLKFVSPPPPPPAPRALPGFSTTTTLSSADAIQTMLERQIGQLEWFFNQVSMQATWKAWVHSGNNRKLSPSWNSVKQTEQSVPPTNPSLCRYLHAAILLINVWSSPSPAAAGSLLAASAAISSSATTSGRCRHRASCRRRRLERMR